MGKIWVKGIITSKQGSTLRRELRRYKPLLVDIASHPPYTGRLTAKILARLPGEEIEEMANWLDGTMGSVISALAPGSVETPPGKYPTPELAAAILRRFIPKLVKRGIHGLIITGFSPLSGSHLLRTLNILGQSSLDEDFHIFVVLPKIPHICKPDDITTLGNLEPISSDPILTAMLSMLPKQAAFAVSREMGISPDRLHRLENHLAFLKLKHSEIPGNLLRAFRHAVMRVVKKLPPQSAAHTLRVAADIFFYHDHRTYRKMKTMAMLIFRNLSELVLAIHSGVEALVAAATGDRISAEVVRLMNLQRYHPENLLMFIQSTLKVPNATYLFGRYWMASATYDIISAKPYKDNLEEYARKRLGWHWKIYRDIAKLDYETETETRDIPATHRLYKMVHRLSKIPHVPSDIVGFGLVAVSISYMEAEHLEQAKDVLRKLIDYLKHRDLLSLLGVVYHNLTQILALQQMPAYIYLPYSKTGTKYQILSGGSTRFAPHFFAHYIQDAAGTTLWPKLKDFIKAVDSIHLPVMNPGERAYIMAAEAFAYSLHGEIKEASRRLHTALNLLKGFSSYDINPLAWGISTAVNIGDKSAAQEITRLMEKAQIRDASEREKAQIIMDMATAILSPGSLSREDIESRPYPDDYKDIIKFLVTLYAGDTEKLVETCIRLTADLIQYGDFGSAGWFDLMTARVILRSDPELARQIATKASALFHIIGASETASSILKEFGIGLLSTSVLSSLAEELILHGLKNSMIEMLLRVEKPIEENLLDILMHTLAAVKGTLIIKTEAGGIRTVSKDILGDAVETLPKGDIEVEGEDKGIKVIFRGVVGEPEIIGIPVIRRTVITRLMATIPRIIKAGQDQRSQIYDQLTGTYNRWFTMRKLEELMKKKELLTVIFMDIDKFKKLNDSMGHVDGDKVLSQIGKILTDVTGTRGIVGRYGGDEFIILLPDTDTNMAYMMAKEIIKRIEELNVGISASAGIVSTEARTFFSKEELLHLADQTMYRAKESGEKIKVAYR